MTPRLLTDKAAADYVSLPVAEFKRLMIGRVPLGTKVRYDRRALDAHLDRISGIAAQSPSPTQVEDDSPDAAFDRFLECKPDAARRS